MTPLKRRYCLAIYFACVKVDVRLLSEIVRNICKLLSKKSIIVLFIVINYSIGL